MKLKMGCPVLVIQKLSRYQKSVDHKTYKYWKIITLPSVRSGIFLGYRTIFDGTISYDYEEGHSFIQNKKIRVALVCLSDRENPIYVPIESLEINMDMVRRIRSKEAIWFG